MVVIYWMIAFLIFLGVEAATTSLASIWFAGERLPRWRRRPWDWA